MNCSYFLSLSLHGRRFDPWQSWWHPVDSLLSCQCPFCTGETRTGHSTPDAVLQAPHRGAGSLYWTCQPHMWKYNPGCSWPSLPQGHTADSCLTCCSEGPWELFLQNCFSDSQPQPVLSHGVIPSQKQDWIFSCWTSQGSCRPVSRYLWRVAFSSSELTTPHSLVSSRLLLSEDAILPAWSLMKILNNICASLDPWGVLLVTGHQLSSQFLPTVLSTYPVCISPVGGKKSSGDCDKGSIKSRCTTSTALPMAPVSSLWKIMRRSNLEWSHSEELSRKSKSSRESASCMGLQGTDSLT